MSSSIVTAASLLLSNSGIRSSASAEHDIDACVAPRP
jgi:hypothetical protein